MKFTRTKCLFVSFLLFSTAHMAQFSVAHGQSTAASTPPFALSASISVASGLTPPWIRYPDMAVENTTYSNANAYYADHGTSQRSTAFPWVSTGFMLALIVIIRLLREKEASFKRSSSKSRIITRKPGNE